MRSRLAYIAVLALTIALLVPATAIAAEKQISVDVASARVVAENQLISRGIDPSTAVFQIGAQNYAGPDCPGSGWNCTSAATVVQIATGATFTSANKVEDCPVPPNTPNSCTITQPAPPGGGKNEARCEQRTSTDGPTTPPVQTCTIIQINKNGTNKAFVSQSIKQTQPEGVQDASQTAIVMQMNDMGTNDSEIHQTIEQREGSEVSDAGVDQTQEAHQRANVCQGANPCTTPSNGKNVSVVSQSNAQQLKVHFDGSSSGPINQNQNISATAGPTSLAVVNQQSMNDKNDSRLEQSSREVASVQDGDEDNDNNEELSHPGPFGGTVNQQQGVTGNPPCDNSGLCGHVTQSSTGVLQARERQDELQKLQGPPGASQFQYGPVFCCATQTGVNPKNSNDINQNKVQLHTSSSAFGLIQGHCVSAPDGCNVNQRLRQNGTTQTNSCTGASCTPSVVCQTTQSEGGADVTVCAPCPSEDPLCRNRDFRIEPISRASAAIRFAMIAPSRSEVRSANL